MRKTAPTFLVRTYLCNLQPASPQPRPADPDLSAEPGKSGLLQQSSSTPRLLDAPLCWALSGLPLWVYLSRSDNEPSLFLSSLYHCEPTRHEQPACLSSSSPSTESFSPQQWRAGRCRSPWRTSLLGGRAPLLPSADARCLLHACSCSPPTPSRRSCFFGSNLYIGIRLPKDGQPIGPRRPTTRQPFDRAGSPCGPSDFGSDRVSACSIVLPHRESSRRVGP